MRRLLGPALLIAGVWLVPAAVAQEKENEKNYPLKLGTKWTYKISGNASKLLLKAAKEEKVGDENCVLLEGTLDGNVVEREWQALKADGVYRCKYAEALSEPPLRLLKFPPKKDDNWKQDVKTAGAQITVASSVTIEDVEVPEGKYRNATVVRAVISMGGMDAAKTTSYYADKRGLVKKVIEVGGNTITLELEKFEAP